jgi:hypothetical protein
VCGPYDVAAKRCGAVDGTARFQAPGSVMGCLQRAAANVSDACWVALSATLGQPDEEAAAKEATKVGQCRLTQC